MKLVEIDLQEDSQNEREVQKMPKMQTQWQKAQMLDESNGKPQELVVHIAEISEESEKQAESSMLSPTRRYENPDMTNVTTLQKLLDLP